MSQSGGKSKKAKSKAAGKVLKPVTPSTVKEPVQKPSNKKKPGIIKTDISEEGSQLKPDEKNSSPKIDVLGPNRFQVLSYSQIRKLDIIVNKTLLIKPNRSSLPTIEITLRELISTIRKDLKDVEVITKDVRLNTDVASCALGRGIEIDFKIVDIVFTVDANHINVQRKIRDTIFKILVEKLKNSNVISVNKKDEYEINNDTIKDNYIRMMSRVNNGHDPSADVWSIISIGSVGDDGHIVEMKFIDKMKRQYEFTVDSFQIILDTLLAFSSVSGCSELTPSLFPTVVAESVSGSFHEAMRHLKEKVIFTRQPEEICGGGLLKYCKLLAEGFKQDTSMDIPSIEKHMCSRFFIDYPSIESQRQKLESYLNIYLYDSHERQSKFLTTLQKVIRDSTVSIMAQERSQTLRLISDLVENSLLNMKLKQSIVHLEDFCGRNWILDQVFYGTLYFPQEVYVTSPLNANDPDNLSSNNIIGNQILICTGENSDLNAMISKEGDLKISSTETSSLAAIQNTTEQNVFPSGPGICA